MEQHVVSTQTIGELNRLTRTGLEFDTWSGWALQRAIDEARFILLLDFPESRNDVGSIIFARREVWLVSEQVVMQQEDRRVPSLLADPRSLECAHFALMPRGTEWHAVSRYWIGHQGRFMGCGFGQLPATTLGSWLANNLVDITANFDEALNFLAA